MPRRDRECRVRKDGRRGMLSTAWRWLFLVLSVSGSSACTDSYRVAQPLAPAAADSLNALLDHHAGVAVTRSGASIAGRAWHVTGDTLEVERSDGGSWRVPLGGVDSLRVRKGGAVVKGLLIGFAISGGIAFSLAMASDPKECDPPVACAAIAGTVVGLPGGLIGAIIGADVWVRIEIDGEPAHARVGMRMPIGRE